MKANSVTRDARAVLVLSYCTVVLYCRILACKKQKIEVIQVVEPIDE